MDRRLLFTGEKSGEIRRALVLVSPSSSKSKNSSLESEIRKIHTARERIGRELEAILGRLEGVAGRAFPRIKLDFHVRPAASTTLATILAKQEDSATYRYIASLSPSVSNPSDSTIVLRDLGISHLVSSIFDGGASSSSVGWSSSGGIDSSSVNISIDDLPPLLLDILLDVAMFHSLPALVQNFDSVELRQEFSRKKVEYAARRQLSSFYGPIATNASYFSLASSVRRGRTFSEDDCRRYELLWRDFINTEAMVPGDGVTLSSNAGDREEVVARILERHVRGGQISRRRLQKEVLRLPEGTYLFVLASKKPHKVFQRRKLLMLFGRKRWHSNIWKIVPVGDGSKYVTYYPFVVFSRFVV